MRTCIIHYSDSDKTAFLSFEMEKFFIQLFVKERVKKAEGSTVKNENGKLNKIYRLIRSVLLRSGEDSTKFVLAGVGNQAQFIAAFSLNLEN